MLKVDPNPKVKISVQQKNGIILGALRAFENLKMNPGKFSATEELKDRGIQKLKINDLEGLVDLQTAAYNGNRAAAKCLVQAFFNRGAIRNLEKVKTFQEIVITITRQEGEAQVAPVEPAEARPPLRSKKRKPPHQMGDSAKKKPKEDLLLARQEDQAAVLAREAFCNEAIARIKAITDLFTQ